MASPQTGSSVVAPPLFRRLFGLSEISAGWHLAFLLAGTVNPTAAVKRQRSPLLSAKVQLVLLQTHPWERRDQIPAN